MLRKKTLGAALLVLASMVTACGGSGDDGDDAASITVGVLPLADYSPVYWAEEKGYFDKQGLDVELETLQGGPVGVQKVVTGEVQFSFANSISTTIAAAKGAPVETVALGSSLGPKSNNIYVLKDSPIKTMADLDGKTVGTNTLNNVGDVAFANLAKAEGLDAKPEWVEVPFPEMIPGVQNGSIDAGYVPEPFATAAQEAGLREVVQLVQGPNEALPLATFVTSSQYAQQNPEVVKKFAAAIDQARADMAAHEDDVRAWLPEATGTEVSAAKAMHLPIFDAELSVDGMQRIADALTDLELIDSYTVADHLIMPGS